jgi:Pvc16 N-terminal domain
VTAIQGVDETLKELAKQAVASLSPKPDVTVGPLDREDDDLRLNWFLYRVGPNPAYRNMEPPRTGWRTSRGRPPLALSLSYLLTAFPASATNGGDQEQFAHAGMTAAMRGLHENALVTEDEPALSALAKPLVEPLRITMQDLDLEAISKIWTAVSKPLRLSVGYEVSLVVVDSTQVHAAGPPVRTRRVAVAPSLGPRLVSVTPGRIGHGVDFIVAVEGLTSATVLTLAREDGDPAGPDDWPLTVVEAAAGSLTLQLPDPGLAPGARRIDATASEAGLLLGRDTIGLTVVPRVTGPETPLAKGTAVTLTAVHATSDVEVFLGGAALPSAQVSFVSPTEISVTIPGSTPAGATDVMLRAGKVAGPPTQVEIA